MVEENTNIESEELNTSPMSPAEQLMIIDDATRWLKVMEQEKPDMVYFLDKSARPLYWLLRQIYKRRGDNLPQIRFLNIGEEKTEEFEFALDHSDFPELFASKKFSPSRVMVVDERSHSGKSLEKGARVIQRLYSIQPKQVIQYSVLSAFPSWIRNSKMIGVSDPADKRFNPLSQPAQSREGSKKLRKGLYQLVPSIETFGEKSERFWKIEEGVKKKPHDCFTDYKPPLAIPLVWNNRQRLFTCDVESIRKVADGVKSGEIDVSEGMRLYYLIKYNRVHPDDSRTENYLDLASPSLNYLAENIISQLS